MARLRREGDKMLQEIQLTEDEKQFLIELETFQGIVHHPEEPIIKFRLISLYNDGLIEDHRTRNFKTQTGYVARAEITQEGREYLRKVYGGILS